MMIELWTTDKGDIISIDLDTIMVLTDYTDYVVGFPKILTCSGSIKPLPVYSADISLSSIQNDPTISEITKKRIMDYIEQHHTEFLI